MVDDPRTTLLQTITIRIEEFKDSRTTTSGRRQRAERTLEGAFDTEGPASGGIGRCQKAERIEDFGRHSRARRDLALESAIAKLDKYHLLILDDFAYAARDQAETSVLFELISARYERRSMLITANQPFGEWNKVFPDPAMTLAAVDRLVHHAAIFELNVESYRRRQAIERKRGPGRPTNQATTANLAEADLAD